MTKILRTFREFLRVVALLAIVLAILFLIWCVNGFVSNRNIQDTMLAETATVRTRVDARADDLGRRIDALGAKLDAAERRLESIDGKLDRLVEFALRPHPDGLEGAR